MRWYQGVLVRATISLLGLCFMPSQLLAANADATKPQFDEVQRLVDSGRMADAMKLLEQLNDQYPNEPSAALNLGEMYTQQHDYARGVRYYEEALHRLQVVSPSDQTLPTIHYRLVDSYNELGQQRYFSPELCLRILYHLEQAWPRMEQEASSAGSEEMRKFVEFARKTVGHYEAAIIGPNVRVKEAGSQQDLAAIQAQSEEPELVLPPDGIDQATKLEAKEAIARRVGEFEKSQPSDYVVAASDRSLDDVLQQLDAAFNRIENVHYRRYREQALVEETWYQHPNTIKTHQRQGEQDAWFLIRNGQLTTFDPTSHKIFNQEPVEGEPGWLMEILKPHARYLQEGGYTFGVQKLITPPTFLEQLYQAGPTTHLYLLTGTSKSTDGVGYPPVVKAEYVVDLDRGLIVGIREYWHGVLGSGQAEELAVTDIVTQTADYPQSVILPVAGSREQLVDEFPATGRRERAAWQIEYDSLNKPFNQAEFDLAGYTSESSR